MAVVFIISGVGIIILQNKEKVAVLLEDVYILLIFARILNCRLDKKLCIKNLMRHAVAVLCICETALSFG